jgi:peptidoglycan/LPS O-acetylase OafA/YrhL
MTETLIPKSAESSHQATFERAGLVRPPGTRLMTLDAMRCVAAAAVVLIHSTEADSTQPLARAARFAVPFFFAAGGYFAARTGRGERGWGEYVVRRARRLYVPFLAWAAIYYAVRYAVHFAIPSHPPPYTSVNLLADSPAQHLWFLPGLLVASVAVFSLARGLQLSRAPAVVSAALFAILAVLTSFWHIPPAPLFPYTVRMTWGSAPALFGGAAAALFVAGRPALPRWVGYASAFAFVACLAREVSIGRSGGVENAAGVLLLLVGVALPPTPGMPRLARWGALAFGVYVIHVLFVEAAQDAMNLAHTRPSLVRDLSIMAFGLVASVVTVGVLMRWRWTRWMVAVG